MLTGNEIYPLEETVNICVLICICSFQVRISYSYYVIDMEKHKNKTKILYEEPRKEKTSVQLKS